MVAYHSSSFGDVAKRFGYLQLKTAVTDSTIMSFACFVHVTEQGVANSFLLVRLRTLAESGRVRANKGVLAPLPCKMRAGILMRGPLRIISS